MLGTQLHTEVRDLNSNPWYCPRNLDDTILWVNEEYILPPLLNCLADWLTLEWNPATQTVSNRTNTTVFVTDWGGESSFRWVDTGLFGYPVVPSLVHVLDYFHDRGYTDKEDLYGAPYDWRISPVFIGDFLDAYKSLIEGIYARTSQKVAIFAYSCGGFITYLFLTRRVTQEWKDKYIDRVLFGSASQGGAMNAARVGWDHWYDLLPDFLRSDALVDLIVSAPTMYGQLPNFNVFVEKPIAIGPDGREYSAAEFPQLLADSGKLTDYGKIMVNRSWDLLTDLIADPGVNAYILFNSGLVTPRVMNFENGWDEPYTLLNDWGDGTVSREGQYHMCNRWGEEAEKRGKTIVCHDLNTSNTDYDHMGMLSMQEFIETAYEIMTGDDWLVGGSHKVSGLEKIDWTGVKRRPQKTLE
jgi:lecithin-cholesterol acyltransferase